MYKIMMELPCIFETALKNGRDRAQYLLAVNRGGMQGGVLPTDAKEIGDNECFTLVFDTNEENAMAVRIQTNSGHFLKIKTYINQDPANRLPVHVDAYQAREWEQFTLCFLESGCVAFRTADGHYMSENCAMEEDAVIRRVRNMEEASWFHLIPKTCEKSVPLPKTAQRSYFMASTDREETVFYAEEFIRAMRGKSLEDGNLLLTGGKLHIWAAVDYITGIALEFPKLNLTLGEEGIEINEVHHYVIPLLIPASDPCLKTVTIGRRDGHIVALRLQDRNEEIVGDFCCQSYDKTVIKLEAEVYTIDDDFELVGLLPALESTETHAIKDINLLYCSVKPSDDMETSPFKVVHYRSSYVNNLHIQGLEKGINLKTESGIWHCETAQLTLEKDVKNEDITCLYVHEVSVERGGNNSRLYGALCEHANSASFPQGVNLEVLGKDNEYLECEFSDEHCVVHEGDSLFYFADHKPEGENFTVILSKEADAACYFELQYLSDYFDAEAEYKAVEKQLPVEWLMDEGTLYPYFRRPLHKLSLVMQNSELAEDTFENTGRQSLSAVAVFGGLYTWVAANLAGTPAAALLLTNGLIAAGIIAAAAVAGAGVYIAVSLCRKGGSGTATGENRNLKKLREAIAEKEKITNAVYDQYQTERWEEPDQRRWQGAQLKGIPKHIAVELLVLQKTRVEGKEYAMSSACQDAVKKAFLQFQNEIKDITDGNISVFGRTAWVGNRVEITRKAECAYLTFEEVQGLSGKVLPMNRFSYLFVAYPGEFYIYPDKKSEYLGITQRGVQNEQAYVAINAGNGQKPRDENLLTSVFVHEFLHTREGIKEMLPLDIPFPNPDQAGGDPKKGWNRIYPDVNYYMGYYYDILNAAVPYQPAGRSKTYAGMFHKMWMIQPGFRELGEYRIRMAKSKKYLTADLKNRRITAEDFQRGKERSQTWRLIYDRQNLIRIAAGEDRDLYWDVENMWPSGNIQLYPYQSNRDWREAQQFYLTVTQDGFARIESMVKDTSIMYRKFVVHNDPTGLRIADSRDVIEQKWVLERADEVIDEL